MKPITLKDFDALTKRDFDNGAVLDAIREIIKQHTRMLKLLKGMIAISNLWIPSEVNEEHRGEAEVLHGARDSMLDAIKEAEEK